jgi:hypothetical protein
MNTSPNRLSYWFGCLGPNGSLALAAVIDALDEQDVAHTVLLCRVGESWSTMALNSRSIGVHQPESTDNATIVPCFDGSVCFVYGEDQRWEVVGRGPEMPGTLRRLTFSRVIDSYLYVTGMQRQVFRRALTGRDWQRHDNECLVPSDSTEIAGFNAIDGLNGDLMYAAGYGGEIWRREGARWIRCASPTNSKLVALCIDPTGVVYAAGANGLLLCGEVDRWEVIEHGATTQGFVAAEMHQGQLYLATERGGLFTLRDRSLQKVDLPLGATVHALHSKDEQLLALGYRGACIKSGDALWQLVPLPQFGSADASNVDHAT